MTVLEIVADVAARLDRIAIRALRDLALRTIATR